MSEVLSTWSPVLSCWFPHSGGRWLNRELMSRHPDIHGDEYFFPLLLASQDRLFRLDTTNQVHRSRSQKDLEPRFVEVKKAMDDAVSAGIETYLSMKFASFTREASSNPDALSWAALPVGQIVECPRFTEMERVLPSFRMVHLVRDPVACFASLKSRGEMGADPFEAGTKWVSLNAAIRHFFSTGRRRDRYRCIRYEDLRQAPEETVTDMLEWLGKKWSGAQAEGIGQYQGRNRDADPLSAVTDEEVEIIRSLTETERKEYGYD